LELVAITLEGSLNSDSVDLPSSAAPEIFGVLIVPGAEDLAGAVEVVGGSKEEGKTCTEPGPEDLGLGILAKIAASEEDG
jgi:hypothetical protein